MSSHTPGKHAVYTMFNAAGEVIYVGCTVNPVKRFLLEHQYQKAWVHEVVMMRLLWCPDLDTALATEKTLIQRARPKYNVKDHPDHGPTRVCPKCQGEKEPGPAYCKKCKSAVNKAAYQARKRGGSAP